MGNGSTVLRNYLNNHVGEEIPLEVLNVLCENEGLHHWDRVVRNLEQQEGYDIERKRGVWIKLKTLSRKPVKGKRGNIGKKLRFLVFERDNYTCQGCGRTVKEDGVKLSPDHIIPVDWGGETTLENLQSLCRECNEGKQAWITGEDASVMEEVNKQTNTEDRLRVYFLSHPNEELDVDRLAVVAKTREWTRQLRKLREDTGMLIEPRRKNKGQNRRKDTYIYLKEV
jgi:5-methylcytosine-specific restriction endonuclease McrA